MGFIVFLLFVIVFLFFFFLSLGMSLLSSLMRGVMRLLGLGSSADGRSQRGEARREAPRSARPASEGKIFGDDEGEYVDFEEIKDV